MMISIQDTTRFAQTFAGLVEGISTAVLDKEHTIRLAPTTMFAGGHLLLEDVPDTGKTALAHAMLKVINSKTTRIQFTPSLLPSDTTGANMYNQKTGNWRFHRGPILAEIILVGEINHASPRIQSALLEMMEETQVTADGVRHPAPAPFIVIATQSPIEQVGTYPLPEAQLDRFLMKTSIGYPSRAAVIDALNGAVAPDRSQRARPLLRANQVVRPSELAALNHTDRAILDYTTALAKATRADGSSTLGVSMRGAIGMTRCIRVQATTQGRNFVLLDGIKDLAVPMQTHRILVDPGASFSGITAEGVVKRALITVPTPAVGT